MDEKMDLKKKSWQSWVRVVVFCILVFGFTAATLLSPSAEFSERENRVLAGKPRIKADAVLSGDFEADYEEYLTDQFVLRNEWISFKTAVERLLFKRESKDIYFAEDDYLIERHTGVFETQMAARNREALIDFVRQYEEKFGQARLSVLVVPNAVDILQDKLPPFAGGGGGIDYLKKLAEELPEEVWVDGAAILREHSSEEIYYRTDHHWKTLAAFYVYQAWAGKQGYVVPELADYEIQAVTDCFEGTVQSKLGIRTKRDTIELFIPLKEPVYTVYHYSAGNGSRQEAKDSLYDYDMLNTKDKYAVYFGGNEPFMQIRTGTGNGRKILVIKDSYANCFLPFMLGEFQEIFVLDLRYINQTLSEMMAEGGYTDVLVLYNAAGFAEDMSIAKLTG